MSVRRRKKEEKRGKKREREKERWRKIVNLAYFPDNQTSVFLSTELDF